MHFSKKLFLNHIINYKTNHKFYDYLLVAKKFFPIIHNNFLSNFDYYQIIIINNNNDFLYCIL